MPSTKMKTERPGPDQKLEEVVDVPIDVRPLMEDRIGMVLAARGEATPRGRPSARPHPLCGCPAGAGGHEKACRVLEPAF